ncbi:MAG: helix-turn-helix transcriptional regulator [Deltaproteobacteria bacterium]|nr:helix-turn-helix transcriptional regulator [Deltaproteobacteria bacterium]
MNIVRHKRREHGWSQEQLAEIADLSKLSVQRAESGRHIPSWDTAQKLGTALGVDAARIRNEAGLVGAISSVMTAILAEREPSARDLRRLPVPIRNVFVNFIETRRVLQEVLSRLSNWTSAYGRSSDSLARAGAEFNELFRDAMSRPPDLETLEQLRAQRAASEDARLRLGSDSRGFAAVFEELTIAHTAFTEAGIALNTVLLRYA